MIINFLKFLTPFFLLIFIIFLLFKRKSLKDICLKNFSIGRLTKFGFISASAIKLSISLYIISFIITSNSFYAFFLMLFLLFSIGFILYKLWIFSKEKQKKILFWTGQIIFFSMCMIFSSVFFIQFLNFWSFIQKNSIYIIFMEFLKNIRFNIIFSLSSVLIFKFCSAILSSSLSNLRNNDYKKFSFFIKIFDFLGFFPKILFGLSCFFLNSALNPQQNFLKLILICSINSVLFYVIQDIKKKFLDYNSFDLHIIDNEINLEEKKLIKKNQLFKIQDYISLFWLFFNEITILIPVFFLSKNLKIHEFYSNLVMKIFNIQYKNPFSENLIDKQYIIFSGIIFFIFYIFYRFLKKEELFI